MSDLKPEAVGPYIALLAYARAAGAPDPLKAKAIVDDVLVNNPATSLPDCVGLIETACSNQRSPFYTG